MERRALLRGALLGSAHVALGLPLLDVMLNDHGTALAQGGPLPRRLGIFFFGNGRGVNRTRFRPSGAGADWALSPLLAPLTPVKDYVSVVTGMQCALDRSQRAHHQGCVAMLSGHDFLIRQSANAPFGSTFSEPSLDQRIANAVGAETPFRSLELGVSRLVNTAEGTTLQCVSHRGPDLGNPAEVDPAVVFDRLFVRTTDAEGAADSKAVRTVRGSVLDTVRADLQRLSQRVSAADRLRLEQHAEGIRTLERRIAAESELTARCAEPARPTALAEDLIHEPLAERMAAHAELLAIALACDMTRAFSIQFSGSIGGTIFWQAGADRGHHELSHEGAASQEVMDAITLFIMEQLATLLVRLRDTPDGTGNLLDSVALLATSDVSDGTYHHITDMPVLVAGRAGGALVHPGVHYASSGEHTNSVLLTLLRAAGLKQESLGSGGALTTEGCAALEA